MMEATILFFGRLVDITGSGSCKLTDVTDTDSVIEQLQRDYPALKQSKYLVAVDKKVVSENIALTNNCTVALLPPFSGG